MWTTDSRKQETDKQNILKDNTPKVKGQNVI